MFFKKYIVDLKNVMKSGCDIKIQKNCKLQMAISNDYLKDINTDVILICGDAIKGKKLISSGTGFTRLQKNLQDEKLQIVLETYEKMYPEYEGKGNIEEAIILANIIKINYKLLGYTNYKMYYELGKRCEFIATRLLTIDPKTEWFVEFSEIYKKLKDLNVKIAEDEMKEKIKNKYKIQFDKLDEKFNKRKNNIEFIKFILENWPYKGYLDDKKSNQKNFEQVNQDLLMYLHSKYHPNQYTYNPKNEESQLNYCLMEYIESLLNRLYMNIN